MNEFIIDFYKETDKDGKKTVDHHAAAKQHRVFEQNEESAGRKLTGD